MKTLGAIGAVVLVLLWSGASAAWTLEDMQQVIVGMTEAEVVAKVGEPRGKMPKSKMTPSSLHCYKNIDCDEIWVYTIPQENHFGMIVLSMKEGKVAKVGSLFKYCGDAEYGVSPSGRCKF